jgi:hypothetical protein
VGDVQASDTLADVMASHPFEDTECSESLVGLRLQSHIDRTIGRDRLGALHDDRVASG